MTDEIEGMEFIEPIPIFTDKSTKNDKDDNGLFPMYIYTFGIDCKSIEFEFFIFDINNDTYKDLNYTLHCEKNEFYQSNHHTFNNDTKKYIYNFFSTMKDEVRQSKRFGIVQNYSEEVK